MKDKKGLLGVLLFSLLARLIFLFSYHPIWWDSASLLGMGKYIWSLGSIGFWEYTRPAVWPVVLGFFWKIGLDPVVTGRILELILSLCIIYVAYLCAELLFDKKTAVMTAIIIAVTPVFFFFGFRLYTGIPSTLLALLGFYLFLRKKLVLSGILLSLAFLTRFPQGAIFGALFIFLLIKKSYKRLLILTGAFLIPTVPYLLINLISFQSAAFSIVEAAQIIRTTGWVFIKPWYYYFIQIPLENPLYLFAIPGIYTLARWKTDNKRALLLAFLLPFTFFVYLAHKEMRFTVVFLPYLAILSAWGIQSLKKLNRKHIFSVILVVLMAVSLFNMFFLYLNTEPRQENWLSQEYFRYLETKEVAGEVLVANPYVTLYNDIPYRLMYFPAYGSALASQNIKYIQENADSIQHIFWDSCEGGTLCPPQDKECLSKTEELVSLMRSNFEVAYEKDTGRCYYAIFSS